ncbi:MAG: patatin-like phospholipase family protein [Betaproteobacteria bacterium]|nr:patatin-like phospholipase family protein [Betaproteobacteria bacterium]
MRSTLPGRRRYLLQGTIALLAGTGAWWTMRDPQTLHRFAGEHWPRTSALSAPPAIALALGGGGPRGFAHVGVLKVLEREGVRPDFIIGSSMGALIGILYAADPDARRIEHHALALDVSAWWRDLTLRRNPWLRGDALEARLRDLLQRKTLESLAIAAAAVSTDLESGMPVAFTRGDAVTAIRASTAVPGTFKRVGIGNREYVDGDLTAPVPVRLARELGARTVIAVDVMCHPAEMVQDLRETPDWMVSDYYRHALNLRDLPLADVVISPRLGLYAGFADEERRRYIALGEQATMAALPALRALMQKSIATPARRS